MLKKPFISPVLLGYGDIGDDEGGGAGSGNDNVDPLSVEVDPAGELEGS